MGRVGGLVLDPQLPEPEPLRQAVDAQERRETRGQDASPRRLHGQKVAVAPQRLRSCLNPAPQLGWIRAGTAGVPHFERAEALLARVPGVEGILGLAFLTAKRLWRHM